MKGRRLPVQADGTPTWPERAGDYCGPVRGYSGDREAVFFLLPGATVDDEGWSAASPDAPLNGLHHVTFPPHTYRECADGSLEIRASIGAYGPGVVDRFVWHGYLDEGHEWREV